MRKIPTLFVREFLPNHKILITDQVTPGCEWVLAGEGVATRKLDGTCTLVQDGRLNKRYDAKNGKPIPPNAVPCQPEADPITGHLPCWMPVSETDPGDKWFVATFKSVGPLADGTYELCGPHFNSNREKLDHDAFFRHGDIVLEGVPRDFNGIRAYLEMHNIEGIVFHRGNGEMCKIKRSDFGFRWGQRERSTT